MAIQLVRYTNTKSNLPLRVARGHFATSHSHINYYIDREIFDKLSAYAQEQGQTMTMAIERIIKAFFEKEENNFNNHSNN